MTIAVKKGNDPFKKYWWIILLIFGISGGWVCLPLMESGVGGTTLRSEKGLKTMDQNLDAEGNPQGAPGGVADLSMPGAKKKGEAAEQMSSLYQAAPESAAPGAPLAAGASGSASFAEDLKAVSGKKSGEDSGWGGDKAQKGFTQPKGNFSSLSGLGSGGASSGSGSSSVGAFGAPNASVGWAQAKGLSGDAGSQQSKGGNQMMRALRTANSQGLSATSQRGMDFSKSVAGSSFDGSQVKSGGTSIGGDKGQGGAYAALDAAPINLKPNNPNANKKDNAIVPKPVPTPKTDMAETIMNLVVTTVVGGVVGGVVGKIFDSGKDSSKDVHIIVDK